MTDKLINAVTSGGLFENDMETQQSVLDPVCLPPVTSSSSTVNQNHAS